VRRIVFASLAFVAHACSSEPRPLWVDYPPLDGAQAVIFAVHGEHATVVHAVDVSARTVLRFDASVAEDTPALIEALVYRESLSDFGLLPGVLVSGSEGEHTRRIPDSTSTWRVEVRGLGDSDGWRPADQRSDAVAAFRIPAVEPLGCADFEARTIELPTLASTSFAERDISGDVLVGTSDEYFRVGTSSVTRLRGAPGPLTSAFLDPTGTWWFGGVGGALWTGSVSLAFHLTPAPALPHLDTIRWLDGGVGPSGVELVALTRMGRVARFVSGTWTILFEFEPPPSAAKRAGIAWTGPGSAVVAWPFEHDVLKIDGDDAVLEPTAAPHHWPSTVGHVPGRGAVIGTSDGAVLDRSRGSWQVAPGVGDLEVHLHEVFPFPNGYLVMGDFGTVRQWVSPGALCSPQAALLPDAIERVAQLGDDQLVLSGGNPHEPRGTPVSRVRFTFR